LATAYNSKNDHRRALKAAQAALLYAEDEEVLAAVHYQIGLVYDHRGPRMTKKKRQALAAFERALELSDGEHQGAMRAVFRISKETNNTERLTELEARYPGVQVATRAEQRRAVRPKKPVRKVKPSSRELEHGRIPQISVFATVDEGKLFDCATGLAIEAEEEQARLGEFSEGTRQIGEGITKPEKVSTSPPQYTREARKERVEGVVIVQSVIDSAGEVRFIKVLKGLPLGLNREAIHAICHWKFKPARVADGSAVAVYYNLTVNFRLQ
jgi:TonB family protein